MAANNVSNSQNSENKMVSSKERQMCFKRELVKLLYVVVRSRNIVLSLISVASQVEA